MMLKILRLEREEEIFVITIGNLEVQSMEYFGLWNSVEKQPNERNASMHNINVTYTKYLLRKEVD